MCHWTAPDITRTVYIICDSGLPNFRFRTLSFAKLGVVFRSHLYTSTLIDLRMICLIVLGIPKYCIILRIDLLDIFFLFIGRCRHIRCYIHCLLQILVLVHQRFLFIIFRNLKSLILHHQGILFVLLGRTLSHFRGTSYLERLNIFFDGEDSSSVDFLFILELHI